MTEGVETVQEGKQNEKQDVNQNTLSFLKSNGINVGNDNSEVSEQESDTKNQETTSENL